MAIGSILAAGVLAMGVNGFAMGPWSPVDLPYPDVAASEAMGGSSQAPVAQVADTVAAWAKKQAPHRKYQITEVKVDGTRATAKVLVMDRVESLKLERVGDEWKIQER